MKQEHWLGLQDRVCVVTGAASGIGAGIAQALADAGAKVALLDRNIDCMRHHTSITSQGRI
jgi:NAD(P)-dependent dehydrogenase (short-subunit alcohol dehydrogenase family)